MGAVVELMAVEAMVDAEEAATPVAEGAEEDPMVAHPAELVEVGATVVVVRAAACRVVAAVVEARMVA